MKKALLVSVVAASSFILSGALQAGNNPNSARNCRIASQARTGQPQESRMRSAPTVRGT
jgi:hypothetical protein